MAVMLSMGKPLSSEAPEFKPLSSAAPEFKPLSSQAPVFKPNVEAAEFVPGGLGLSAKAAEFVPTWARPTGFTSPAPVAMCAGHGNMFMLDMDQYSDYSEDEPSCTTKDLDEPSSDEVDMPETQAQKLPPWKRVPTVEAENKLAAVEGQAMPWRADDISEPEQEEGVASQAEGAVEQAAITPKLTQGSEGVRESNVPDAVTDAVKVGGESEDDLAERLSVEEPDAEQSTDEIEAMLASDSEGKSDDGSSTFSACFTMKQMLLWRAAAMDLTDPHVVYSAMAEPTVSAPSKPRTKKGGRNPSSPGTTSWRGQHQGAHETKTHDEEEGKSKQTKLERSGSSWVEQQRLRRSATQSGLSDEDIVRAMKSILNKLTIEKYSQLYSQMITCGIKTDTHVELLIEEVFEKAITQHHFIEMYADLCAHLHEHFVENPIVTDDPKKNFKKVLLNACQASFERNLTPPQDLGSLDEEERVLAEIRYKTRMLGNIRFVGALLTRKMLASKVLLAIMDELLSDPTPEALESLAALLTVVGPVFDGPAWSYHVALNAIFEQVKKIVKKSSTEPRVRCLMKDVLDLRAAGWKDRKPKKIDGPTTLDAVAHKQAQEEGAPTPQKSSAASVAYDGWEQVPMRASRAAVAPLSKVAVPKEKVKSSKSESRAKAKFDREDYHVEVGKTIQELRVSHDVKGATARLAEMVPPLDEQPTELCDLLGRIVEEGSAEVRKAGFEVVANLYIKGHWKSEIKAGLRVFMSETCADLKYDVPTLPNILKEELHPGLLRMVKRGLLSASKHDLLLQEI